jgi:hypothetical protein
MLKNSTEESPSPDVQGEDINLNTNAMAFTPSGPQPGPVNYPQTGNNLTVPGKAPLHPNTNLRPSTKPIDWSKLDSSSFEPSSFSGEI